jgi:hypothetical protein
VLSLIFPVSTKVSCRAAVEISLEFSNIFVVIYVQQMAAESQEITGKSRSEHFTPAKP